MRSKNEDRFFLPIPHSLGRSFSRMTGDEVKQYLIASMNFSMYGVQADDNMSPAATIAYDVTVDLIERKAKHDAEVSEKRSEAAKGNPKKKKGADDPDPDPAPVRPTPDEVKAYADANGLTTIDPQRFLNACQAAGWMYNRQPMNWQAYAKMCHNKAMRAASSKTVTAQQYTQRGYTSDELASLDYDVFAEAEKLKNEQ